MKKNKKTTMAELARVAGVDVSTVSRALNNSPMIKQETKDEIRKIADDLGYAVNAAARNLRMQSSQTIGIVIPLRPDSGQTLSDPFFLDMVASVSMAAAERDYDLIIHIPHGEQPVNEKRLLQTGKADGLIVIGQAGRLRHLNELGEIANKIVVWGGVIDEVNYTVVGSDNVFGGRAAAQHLLELGRKHILFIGDVDLPEIALRYTGFKEKHHEMGVELDPKLTLKLDFGPEMADMDRAIFELIQAGVEFDAVFAASDRLAIVAIDALRHAGLSVPDDVSVVGYDNIAQAVYSRPALTTIDQHIKEGGRLMVNMLLDKLAGKPVPSTMTETSLVVRDSTSVKKP